MERVILPEVYVVIDGPKDFKQLDIPRQPSQIMHAVNLEVLQESDHGGDALELSEGRARPAVN